MEEQETGIRWKQRFQNLEKAYARLRKAVDVVAANTDDELLQAGLIQTFEFTFELARKTLKDILTKDGYDVNSPKATLRTAFANGYIADGELWLQALDDRNLTTRTYDEDVALGLVRDIINLYQPMLERLTDNLRARL